MIRSGLLLFLFASVGLAEHEDIVDTILTSISGKFTKTPVPSYFSSMHQNVKSFNIAATLSLRNGQMTLNKLARNGVVGYVGSSNDYAVFRFRASLETFITYDYSLASTSSMITSGSATADWKLDVKMTITAMTRGCQLKMHNEMDTQNFEVQFYPREARLYPLTVHYPVGDVVEQTVIPALEAALDKASDFGICDIFNC